MLNISGLHASFGWGAETRAVALEALDHVVRKRIFACLAGALTVAVSFYGVVASVLDMSAYRPLLAALLVTTLAAAAWGRKLGDYSAPLLAMCSVTFLLVSWATLMQGPDIPAAGWWLSIFPFILAGAGFHSLAIAAVVAFLGVVTATHTGLPAALGLPIEPTVEPWRRHVAIAGSETLALGLILVSMQARSSVARALDEARATAKKAMDIKARFLANISHEIRTPLNGIVGASELMDSKTVSTPQLTQLIGLQRLSAKTLLALVNDVLDVAKLDAGRVVLESEPVSIRDIVFEANELFCVQAFAKGIELSSSCDPHVPTLFTGDGTRIRQIVNNLVSNAVKFTAMGGVHIHLATEPAPDQGQLGRATIRIDVKDTGIGLSAAQRERLFTPFVQADSSTHRRFGGTGLGLSIAQELAKLMGGRISVQSQLDTGSTFSFVVPLTIQAPALPTRDPHERRDICLVTRNDGLERHIASLLNQLGIVPLRSATLPSGAELARYRLLLVDDAVLKDSGIALAEATFANGPKLVVFTSLGASFPGQAPERAAIVYKPVRRQALQTALANESSPAGSADPDGEGPDRAGLDGVSVLVADDNAVNRILTEAMLAELGCTSVAVSNGREAVDQLATRTFDIVLMDVHMPEMDGLEATRYARAAGLPAGVRIPIMAMTADVDVTEASRYLDAGMSGVLPKPFTLAELRDCLVSSLPGSSARSSTGTR